jgi:hypothetical protein
MLLQDEATSNADILKGTTTEGSSMIEPAQHEAGEMLNVQRWQACTCSGNSDGGIRCRSCWEADGHTAHLVWQPYCCIPVIVGPDNFVVWIVAVAVRLKGSTHHGHLQGNHRSTTKKKGKSSPSKAKTALRMDA